MDNRLLADLIVHLARIASADDGAEGLTSNQWLILRYFARANRFSRKPAAFAMFHGTTKGTASQAIKNLVAQGYLRPTPSDSDGRSVRLDLSDKARAILPNAPHEALVRAAGALPPGVRGQLANVLRRMLGYLASEKGRPQFGTCRTCQYLVCDGSCGDRLVPYVCGLQNEPLKNEELDELCINFMPDTPAPSRPPDVGAA